MARLNKIQKYAVLWLNSQGWPPTKIANELSLTDSQVTNTVRSTGASGEEPKIKTVSSPVKNQSPSKNLMITESAGKTRSVSIMTKEASQLNDDFKKTANAVPKRQKGIFRPNP